MHAAKQHQQQQEGEGVERGRLEQASASSLGGLAGRRVSPSPTGGQPPPPGPRAAAEGAAAPKVQFDPAAAVARQVRAGARAL
eukprot:COSAG01_NODE_1689_length_9488_cov_5.759825_4_plen_83_part_00